MAFGSLNTRESRRQVLRGTGGLALALPFLPSLQARSTWAQEAVRPKRFIAFTTGHGGIHPSNMYPGDASLTAETPLYSNHPVRHGALVARMQGNATSISPVLSAASNVLTPRLVSKMNVLRGFDWEFYAGHHAADLGNFAANNGFAGLSAIPSIDQLLAWSPNFYPNLNGIVDRSVPIANERDHSIAFGYSNPAAGTGTIARLDAATENRRLFDRLVAGRSGQTPPVPVTPPRVRIVDRVLENYRRLRQSDRRLSTTDRQRLDDHMGQLNDLERRLTAAEVPATSASCSEFTRPAMDSSSLGYPVTGLARAKTFWGLVTDVMAMALACDSTRVVTFQVGHTFSDDTSNWHQDIAHNSGQPAVQQVLAQAHQATFEFAIAKLASALDSIADAPGQTLLDNTLLQWTQESGETTHQQSSMPIVTFGSARGFFKTGNYVDYRRPADTRLRPGRTGLLHRQWLANALQSMGISPAEFELPGLKGYGVRCAGVGGDPWDAAAWSPGVATGASNLLSVITG
ncbi:MAG: DUF1552 domain-containing protein [Deltaproteobacteria bacterium]|nr:DUF1552 domain-containing protein [Deltaproteobacteria bacterium]